jgi:hypothetical protein
MHDRQFMHRRWIAALFVCLCGGPSAALSAANDVVVTIQDGRATVTARNAAVTDVLDAWSRAGGTTILNGEVLAESRLTIELVDVPEEQALDVILRPASGYVARQRANASAGESRFDRVVVVARRAVPAVAPAEPPVPEPILVEWQPPAGVQRLIGPDGNPVPDDQQDAPPQAPRGFSRGDEVAAPPAAPPDAARPQPQPAIPQGVPVPGMLVPSNSSDLSRQPQR